MKRNNKIAIFGGGCFWGVEEAFRILPGVIDTEVGYAGGDKSRGTYEEVCSGKTGHTEVVRIIFDDEKISYSKLIEIFFSLHDPTQINRQGPDIGFQYRSVIFYLDEKQKEIAKEIIKKEQKKYSKKISTVLEKATTYIKAEDYHQKYLFKRGQSSCHI